MLYRYTHTHIHIRAYTCVCAHYIHMHVYMHILYMCMNMHIHAMISSKECQRSNVKYSTNSQAKADSDHIQNEFLKDSHIGLFSKCSCPK